jgi:hypothetical protein
MAFLRFRLQLKPSVRSFVAFFASKTTVFLPRCLLDRTGSEAIIQFNSIQFNSIYLCAKRNSHRPITKLAQVVQRRRRRSKALES